MDASALQLVSFRQVTGLKFCMHFLPPCVLHIPPIFYFLCLTMWAHSKVQKFLYVLVIIHLINRRHDSSVILAVARSAFSPVYKIFQWSILMFRTRVGYTLDVRIGFMLYICVLHVRSIVIFFYLCSTRWKEGIVNSWYFTVSCCSSLNARRSNEGFGKQRLLAGVRFLLYKFLNLNRPSG